MVAKIVLLFGFLHIRHQMKRAGGEAQGEPGQRRRVSCQPPDGIGPRLAQPVVLQGQQQENALGVFALRQLAERVHNPGQLRLIRVYVAQIIKKEAAKIWVHTCMAASSISPAAVSRPILHSQAPAEPSKGFGRRFVSCLVMLNTSSFWAKEKPSPCAVSAQGPSCSGIGYRDKSFLICGGTACRSSARDEPSGAVLMISRTSPQISELTNALSLKTPSA
nr:hypothetical protein [uncultured Oscillibacter sp.]